MIKRRPAPRGPWTVLPSAIFALGPILALAATLSLAPKAAARPKTCAYKPAACQLEARRAERRAEVETPAAAQAKAPRTGNLHCASKTAVCDLQTKARARQAEALAASPEGAATGPRAPVCNLKPAACWLEQRRATR